MKMKITQETMYRCIRTFVQAFVATVITDIGYISFNDDINWKMIISTILIPAISAGCSAIMNLEVNEEDDGVQ